MPLFITFTQRYRIEVIGGDAGLPCRSAPVD